MKYTRLLLRFIFFALTASLAASQTSDLNFAPVVTYDSGGVEAYSVAVADVNGDGKPDLVVANANNCVTGNNCSNSATVAVLLGNGDGTFQSAVTYNTGGYDATSVAVADVNGDGKPDVVVVNLCANFGACPNGGSVSVLLGNGDGTFQTAVSYASGGIDSDSVAVADVDGDGKPDIVIANQCVSTSSCYGTVSVLLGNGDGTFRTAVVYDSGGQVALSVTIADVNGDGKRDLIVANHDCAGTTCNRGSATVLLGNGDGTFQTAVSYDSGSAGGLAVAVADVNEDGTPDLIVANECASSDDCTTGSIGILLGNGDGTFKTAVTYGSGGSESGLVLGSVTVVDANGDGKPDVVVTNQCGGSSGCSSNGLVGVLLGNGDGTFQSAVTYNTGGYYATSVAVADVNGDSKPDLVVANRCATINGGPNCPASNNGSVGVLISTSTPATTTALVSSLNPSNFGQSVTFTATVTPQGTGTPTGTVTFTDAGATLGAASLTSGAATLSTSLLTAGTHSITAAYSGDSNFASSSSSPLLQTVNRITTTTSLSSSADPVSPNQSVTYTATVTSQYGGAVTGTVNFNDGTSTTTVPVAGGNAVLTETYTITGIHSVTATYSGDSNNAGSASGTLKEYVENLPVVSKTVVTTSGSPSLINQPVTFTAIVTSTYGSIPNGEIVVFYDGATELGTGTTAGGMATFTTSLLSAKTHTIKGTYSGDQTFKTSSGTVQQVVNAYTTTTALSASPNSSNYGETVQLRAVVTTTGSNAPTGNVTFKSGTTTLGTSTLNTSATAMLNTTKLMVGSDSITATYNGDSFNAKSTSPVLTQTVSPAQITMNLTSLPNPSTSGTPVKFTARLTSNGSLPNGQTVTFSYNGGIFGTATISGGNAIFSTTTLPVGSDQVTATFAGNADYSAASASVTQTVH